MQQYGLQILQCVRQTCHLQHPQALLQHSISCLQGTASSDAGQASIKRLQQLHAALRPFVDGELALRFSRVYKELFEGTNERDRLWLLLAFKSVAGKDAAALVACAEALGVSY